MMLLNPKRLAILAVATFSVIWWLIGLRIGFNIWDEGFLWYGVRRVIAGEVPLRDFMSYDIGRYYFSAILMSVFQDDGIVSLRVCISIVQTFGVTLATYLVVKNSSRSHLADALLASGVFVCWMTVAGFKSYDTTALVMLIAGLAIPLEKPTPRRWLIAGVILGFTAMIGRNHGLYGSIAGAGALLCVYGLTRFREAFSSAVRLAAGAIIGYAPNIIMLVMVPGFANAFWDSVKSLADTGTNLTLPIPWPWSVLSGSVVTADVPGSVLLGTFFIAMPVFGIISLIYILSVRQRVSMRQLAVLTSCALLSIPYTHYAYVRADIAHLSYAVFPLLLGLLVFPAKGFFRFAIWGSVLASSLFLTVPNFPIYQAARQGTWKEITIDGSNLTVDESVADQVNLVQTLAADYACNERSVYVAPFWPGAYALLSRKAPVWEIYALFPRSVAFQEREIERIKAANSNLAILVDYPLDGRNELRFSNTHALIAKYIRENYKEVKSFKIPNYVEVFVREDFNETCRK
ncbi:hypothetical protein FNL55_19590 [Tardiphaga sp. vice352]|uniref:hypothetical protein n=1 Tax=Tardiphaga sp. vice352 TaxID=2592816 RepID=UPI001163F0FE|nr:hypothetical protein [Tardiphaga sp. vice352]QDM33316.1 hypothetical protein FNL55_19590 [Tardiphaga sp. vice352]